MALRYVWVMALQYVECGKPIKKNFFESKKTFLKNQKKTF